MLLNELTGIKNLSPISDEGAFVIKLKPNQQIGKNSRVLGQGLQGFVVVNKTKPNSVVKVFGYNNEQENEYIRFLRYLQQSHSNPYLPRIYRVKLFNKPMILDGTEMSKIKDFNGKTKIACPLCVEKYQHIGVVELEKLVPITNPKLRRVMFEKLQSMINQPEIKTINDALIYLIDDLDNNGGRSMDPLLQDAYNLIQRFTTIPDLHIENVMVRLTNIGPQLVLVDPISPFSDPNPHEEE